MPIEKLIPNFVFDEVRLNELKQIAPEAFADGKINWNTLKESLGDYLEEDGQESEHFGLFWPGKRDARKLAALPSKGTLIPVPGEGIDEETTRNIFIEGENLEVLKLLQKSYGNPGRIKMIYIDPPYNTGNDFVYEDDFKEPLQEYLKRTGQLDEEGKTLSTNTRADGRFHSKWLSMMYPRLRLARNLMRDDGVIFVSVDDNEVHNLRSIMNEIFGEENFIDCMIWKKRYGGGAKEKYLVTLHEYILVFAKNLVEVSEIFVPLDQESIDRYYKSKDKNFEKRGPYRTHPLEATKSVGKRENLIFPIKAPDGTMVSPERQWWWDKDRVADALKKGELEFIKSKNGKWTVNTKQYLKNEDGSIRKTKSFSIIEDVYTQHGTQEIEELFKDSRIFSFPKPTALIEYLLEICNVGDGDIVADFFAGSAPVAHSLFKYELKHKINLRFLLTQLDAPIEKTEYAFEKGYKFISEISKERIRRSSKLENKKTKNESDLGFNVFKLTTSNYKPWKNYEGQSVEELEKQFALFSTPLIDKWKPENLLSEVLLLEGFPLDSKIELQKDFKKNKVNRVSSDFCEHKLFICLDKKIAPETVANLKIESGDIFICLDSAIIDQDKVRLADKGLIKTI